MQALIVQIGIPNVNWTWVNRNLGAPIHPLAVGVISEVDATMSPELPDESNFQDDDGWHPR